jgi:SAM-dependent methyltransferase
MSKYVPITECFKLLWVALVVKKRNLIEFIKVVKRYYSNPIFRKADLSLLSLYFFQSPYSISKKYLKKSEAKEIYAYGETPLTTLDQIVKECQIKPEDVVFELGCGRGRTCFWLHAFVGCKVKGIDFVPEFINRADRIKAKYHLANIHFFEREMLAVDYRQATVIYLYGTCLEDEEIQQLITKFKKLPIGAKVITVSYSLVEYQQETIFKLTKQFTAPFTWGEADVYLHEKIS